MQPGSPSELAAQRWSQWNAFDLEESEWLRLFSEYGAGVTLEAVRAMREVKDPRPEKRYELFIKILERKAAFYSKH